MGGQTTPPAYEQVTPELFETYQELIPNHTGPPSASPPQSLHGHEDTDDDFSERVDDIEHTMHAAGNDGQHSSSGGRSVVFVQEHPPAIRMLHPASNNDQPARLLAAFSGSSFANAAPSGLELASSEEEG